MPNFNKSKGFQLRSGNKADTPFKMMGSSSPAKGIFSKIARSFTKEGQETIGKQEDIADKGYEERKTDRKTENKKISTAQSKTDIENTQLREDEKGRKQKVRKAKQLKKASTNIKDKIISKNAAKKEKAETKQNLKTKRKEGRVARKEDRTEAKIARAGETKEERLTRRKERNTKIADNLEYIFLDGKRPGARATARKEAAAAETRRKTKFDRKESSQNKQIEYEDNVRKMDLEKRAKKIKEVNPKKVESPKLKTTDMSESGYLGKEFARQDRNKKA